MSKVTDEIRADLFEMQDLEYRDFQAKLMPDVAKENIIGVRTPQLRQYAKQLVKRPEAAEFLNDLPHRYYDENNVHAFLVEQVRDYGECLAQIERFLPYVDNWATCDMMSPKVFGKHTDELLSAIRAWLSSGETYTVRFGIGMLMRLYLDDKFLPEYPALVAAVSSEEYYVNMMIAWYFATALAKQYDAVLPYITEKRLPVWTHNKAIQKACESRRITPEQKEYLRGFKMKESENNL